MMKRKSFPQRWEKQRKNKWRYAFLHGSVYWGLPVAIISFLMSADFKIENMLLVDFAVYLVVFMLVGLAFGVSLFKRIDNIYLSQHNKNEIN